MPESKCGSAWHQRMALIENMTDAQKIQQYHREYPMILQCSRIPAVILQRVLGNEGSIMEQLHLVRNRHIGDDIIKILLETTPFDFVREDAYRRLYCKEKEHQIGLNIIRKALAN